MKSAPGPDNPIVRLHPGAGRVILHIVGPSMRHHSTEEYGGGRRLALDTEEWSKVITEKAEIDWATFPSLPEDLELQDLEEVSPLDKVTFGDPEGRQDLYDEMRQSLAVWQELSAFGPKRVSHVYFAYAAYMEWRELIGSATNNNVAMQVSWLAVKLRDLVAVRLRDGSLFPLGGRRLGYRRGDRMLEQGASDSDTNGVYLLHTTRSLPVVYERLSAGAMSNLHHVDEDHVVAVAMGVLTGLNKEGR